MLLSFLKIIIKSISAGAFLVRYLIFCLALIGRERHSLFLMKSDFKISFVHSKVKKKRPLETELICEQQVKEEKRNDL